MKKYISYTSMVILVCFVFLTNCKKDDSISQLSNSKYSYLVLKEWGPQNADRSFDQFFYFMELGSDDNNIKRVIKTRRIYANSDSLEIIDGPKSMSNFADNWPPKVKSGCSNQWITDFFASDTTRLTQNGFNLGKRQYKYGPVGIIYKFPYGSPEGEASIWNPDGAGGAERINGYFYFKKGLYIDFSTFKAKDLSTIVTGASAYDWKNVDNVFSYITSPGFYTTVFIDYKNWRYFKIEESCDAGPVGACTHITLKLSAYMSLNKLLKWPDGWKK